MNSESETAEDDVNPVYATYEIHDDPVAEVEPQLSPLKPFLGLPILIHIWSFPSRCTTGTLTMIWTSTSRGWAGPGITTHPTPSLATYISLLIIKHICKRRLTPFHMTEANALWRTESILKTGTAGSKSGWVFQNKNFFIKHFSFLLSQFLRKRRKTKKK